MTAKKMNSRSARAFQNFKDLVAARGGTVLEPTWLGSGKPHLVRCAEGHEVTPMPVSVSGGQGICRVCSGRDSGRSWERFIKQVEALGGTVLEPTWLGSYNPHRVRCAAGHDSAPRPSNVHAGHGICGACAGNSPAAAEAAFRARVEALGGTVLEPTWLGKNTPHRVRCAEGHDCTPRPNNVQQGWGICRKCKGQTWDAFYVVVDDTAQTLKFGITSGDGRNRLRAHSGDGYTRCELLLTGLAGTTAPDAERAVKVLLAQRGARPVRGVEYFGLSWLPTVLEVASKLVPTGH